MARDHRIFPTEAQSSLASEKEFTGIDWDSVVTKLASNDESIKPQKGKFPEELKDILVPKNELGEDEDEKDMACKCDTAADAVTAGKCPEHLKKFQFKSKEDGAEEVEGEEEENTEKTAKTRIRKVHFASAEQLSAEALEAAKTSGDEALVNAILAARQDRRMRLANKVIEAEKQQMEIRKAQAEKASNEIKIKVAKRDAYRQAIASAVEEKVEEPKTVSTKSDFKRTSEMSKAEKSAFAEKALAMGYPQEYVDTILGVNAETPVVSEIKEVMSANLPMSTKKAALSGLVKTAELDDAQKQRLVKYWIEDLGYGDEEWVRNWINKTYK